MTLPLEHSSPVSWTEPDGLNPRGTVVVIPGRGEQADVYERFGRRLAADAYRVHAVANPVADHVLTAEQIGGLLAGPGPFVLAGSDTGALFAAGLVAAGRIAADALVLAGLPTTGRPTAGGEAAIADAAAGDANGGKAVSGEAVGANAASGEPGQESGQTKSDAAWAAELEARTACPTHRGRLAGPVLRRGALYEPVPDGWTEAANLKAVGVPVLGLHGAADPVSPLGAAREAYAAAPLAELVSITDGRHDAFNDIAHRSAAATVVLFLERLRLGADLPPVAVRERL